MKRKTFGLGWVMNVEITEQGFGFVRASVAIAVTMAAFASPWCDAWWPEENPPGARSCPLMVHLSRHYVLLASTSPSALEFILPFILFLFLFFFPHFFCFFPSLSIQTFLSEASILYLWIQLQQPRCVSKKVDAGRLWTKWKKWNKHGVWSKSRYLPTDN